MREYVMRGADDRSPTYLQIKTDDTGLIMSLEPPLFRRGDAAIQTLLWQWKEYASVGDPPPAATVDLFNQFLADTYGGTYRVDLLGMPLQVPEG